MLGTDKFLIEPQYTLGAAYSNRWVTTAIDVDVDLNKRRYYEGLNYETQYLKVGAELNAWRWAQIRFGYKHSMTDYSEDVISAGLDFTPFGRFGLEIGGQYGDDSRYGVAAQMIFTF